MTDPARTDGLIGNACFITNDLPRKRLLEKRTQLGKCGRANDVDHRPIDDVRDRAAQKGGTLLAGPQVFEVPAATGDRRRHAIRDNLKLLRDPAQLLLGPAPLGDVAEDHHHADDLSLLIPDRRRAIVDGALGAALVDQDRVIRQADDAAFTQHPPDRVFHGMAGLLVDNAKHFFQRLTGRFLFPAGQGLRDGVHQGDAALGIRDDDAIANAGQGGVQPGFFFAEGCFRALPLRDVAGDLRRPDDFAVLVPDRRNGE